MSTSLEQATANGRTGHGTSLRRPNGQVARRSATASGLSIAVVGCGYWGSKHVRVLSTLPGVARVVAVDRDARVRNGLMAAFPGVVGCAELDEALPEVDAAIIATPPSQHAEAALMALQAGCHVMVEKPLTTTVADAARLVEAARRAGVTLLAGHTFEFNAAVRELRRRIDDGEFGRIFYINSARLNLGLYRSDVNVVWDLAPHDISIMNYLLRSSPTTVTAWGSAHAYGSVNDLAFMRMDYGACGVVGYTHVSWLDPRKVRRVTVVGSRKMAVYDDLAEEKLRIFDCGVDTGLANANDPRPFERPVSYRYGDITSPHIPFEEPLAVEDRHFVDCIRGRATPLADGQSGLAVVATLEALDRSLKTGGTVAVAGPNNAGELRPAAAGTAR